MDIVLSKKLIKIENGNTNTKVKHILYEDEYDDMAYDTEETKYNTESDNDTEHDAEHDTEHETNPQNVSMEQVSYIEEPWDIIKSYYDGQYLDRLVRHQLESYNDFISIKLKKTINMFNPIRICSSNDFDK